MFFLPKGLRLWLKFAAVPSVKFAQGKTGFFFGLKFLKLAGAGGFFFFLAKCFTFLNAKQKLFKHVTLAQY